MLERFVAMAPTFVAALFHVVCHVFVENVLFFKFEQKHIFQFENSLVNIFRNQIFPLTLLPIKKLRMV